MERGIVGFGVGTPGSGGHLPRCGPWLLGGDSSADPAFRGGNVARSGCAATTFGDVLFVPFGSSRPASPPASARGSRPVQALPPIERRAPVRIELAQLHLGWRLGTGGAYSHRSVWGSSPAGGHLRRDDVAPTSVYLSAPGQAISQGDSASNETSAEHTTYLSAARPKGRASLPGESAALLSQRAMRAVTHGGDPARSASTDGCSHESASSDGCHPARSASTDSRSHESASSDGCHPHAVHQPIAVRTTACAPTGCASTDGFKPARSASPDGLSPARSASEDSRSFARAEGRASSPPSSRRKRATPRGALPSPRTYDLATDGRNWPSVLQGDRPSGGSLHRRHGVGPYGCSAAVHTPITPQGASAPWPRARVFSRPCITSRRDGGSVLFSLPLPTPARHTTCRMRRTGAHTARIAERRADQGCTRACAFWVRRVLLHASEQGHRYARSIGDLDT